VLNKLIGIFGVVWFVAISVIFLYSCLTSESYSLWVASGAAVSGWLLADFATGLVHWFGDRFFSPTTPFLGSLLIFPFREHHTDPNAMTRHDFFELCGTSGLLVGILYIVTLMLHGAQSDFLAFFIFFFGLFAFLTNLFHRWAHEDNPHKIIRILQKSKIILDPTLHQVHHRTYDTYYCVTHGHMNKILEKLRVFPVLEKILFFLPNIADQKPDQELHSDAQA
jgi:hypothetical protein